jgi:hypothetical protein
VLWFFEFPRLQFYPVEASARHLHLLVAPFKYPLSTLSLSTALSLSLSLSLAGRRSLVVDGPLFSTPTEIATHCSSHQDIHHPLISLSRPNTHTRTSSPNAHTLHRFEPHFSHKKYSRPSVCLAAHNTHTRPPAHKSAFCISENIHHLSSFALC